MNKKKIFAGLLSLSITFAPFSSSMASESISGPDVLRLGGKNRYETSKIIMNSAKALGANDKIKISNGLSFADALTGGSLVLKEKGIMLLSPKEVNFLGNNITLLGGKSVLDDLDDAKRIGGKDRFETSRLIAESFGECKNAILVDAFNFPDALSALNLSKKLKSSILLTEKNTFRDKDLLNDKNVIILGGENAISSSLQTSLSAKRYGGKNRYDTNMMVLKATYPNPTYVVLASGKNFADALSGSSLLGVLDNSALMLVGDSLTQEQHDYLLQKSVEGIIILGGENSVSKEISQHISIGQWDLKVTDDKTINIVGQFLNQQADYAYNFLNAHRAENNLPALNNSEELTELAKLRALEISYKFSHTRPDGSDLSTLADIPLGENIAYGYDDALSVTKGWRNSPGHNENMLNPNYKSVGISSFEAINPETNQSSIYWVQLFSFE